jgi:hypothetical protein
MAKIDMMLDPATENAFKRFQTYDTKAQEFFACYSFGAGSILKATGRPADFTTLMIQAMDSWDELQKNRSAK